MTVTRQLESKFQKRVLKDLENLDKCYFHKHQAGSIRGIADIVGCLNGTFFALELKRDKASLKITGRAKLQEWTMRNMKKAGGFAVFTCPEIWDATLLELVSFCSDKGRLDHSITFKDA